MTNRIAELLKTNGTDELLFAYKIKVTPQTIWRWKTQKTHPRPEKLILIADFFECDIKDIIE